MPPCVYYVVHVMYWYGVWGISGASCCTANTAASFVDTKQSSYAALWTAAQKDRD